MAPTLYFMPESSPCVSVLFTARAINLELNLKVVNIFKGEQHSAEFHKLNPQDTIPTLVDDDGFTIWESHAINSYLVSKYAKDDSLYPKDLRKRAVVDQRLHFNSGYLFQKIRQFTVHIIFNNNKSIPERMLEEVKEAYGFLEAFLENRKYVAGDELTIADFSLVTTVTYLEVFVPVTPSYKNIYAWIRRMEELPYYEELNRKPVESYAQTIKSALS